jgi:cell filamentation protein
MVYTATDDPACYPKTDVLRNKAGIMDADKLAEFELAMFITRSEENWPEGQFDYEHFLALHHHLFQDVYEWAGQIRKIRTGKSNNWFCYPEYIDQEMQKIFADLANEDLLIRLDRKDFVIEAAHFLAEINAVHAFREGNGRTQITFLILLTENAGFTFDDNLLDEKAVLNAMIASFKGDKTALVDLLDKMVLSVS